MAAVEVVDLVVRRGAFELRVEKLEVSKGEIVLVRGPNGSGKTTLLKAIAGLIRPVRGVISVSGAVVFKALSRVEVDVPPERRGVSYLPQNALLFPHMSVLDNVLFPLKAKGIKGQRALEKARELLDFVGLAGLERRMPHELSGGQRQRAAIAMALAAGSRALLLDEPFSNIDAETRGELRREMARVIKRAGLATLLVSHDPGDGEIADRAMQLRNGRLLG